MEMLLVFQQIAKVVVAKQQITGQTRNGGIKDVEKMVLLKYISNFLENT